MGEAPPAVTLAEVTYPFTPLPAMIAAHRLGALMLGGPVGDKLDLMVTTLGEVLSAEDFAAVRARLADVRGDTLGGDDLAAGALEVLRWGGVEAVNPGSSGPGWVRCADWTDEEWQRIMRELPPDTPEHIAAAVVYAWRAEADYGDSLPDDD